MNKHAKKRAYVISLAREIFDRANAEKREITKEETTIVESCFTVADYIQLKHEKENNE